MTTVDIIIATALITAAVVCVLTACAVYAAWQADVEQRDEKAAADMARLNRRLHSAEVRPDLTAVQPLRGRR